MNKTFHVPERFGLIKLVQKEDEDRTQNNFHCLVSSHSKIEGHHFVSAR